MRATARLTARLHANLINGEKVPGSNDDRSFFLDRIPAELIERVEIVRSSSARRTGDAWRVRSISNCATRSSSTALRESRWALFRDEELEPSLGLVYGGALGRAACCSVPSARPP